MVPTRRFRLVRRRPGLRLGVAGAPVRVAVLVAALVVGSLAGGAAPVAAGAPDPCPTDAATAFVCRAYESFARRPATTAEVEQWAPQMPALRTSFVAGLARGPESREATVVDYYDRFAQSVPGPADLDYWRDQVVLANGLRRLEAALLANSPTTDPELVDLAFDRLLGRGPTPGDRTYWQSRIAQIGRNRVAADIAYTGEARRLRVVSAYGNELLVTVDALSRDYWAERLRTGTSYLDLRIALRSSPDGYATSGAACARPAPQTGPTCA